MQDSTELLRRYAEERTEQAFAELVRRHIDFVYAVALRQLSGDTHLAEDVTQRVFTDLARKADSVSRRPTLSGWLYRSTQFAAAAAVRAERRRRTREQEAHTMNELQASGLPRNDWADVRPELDRVMGRLNDNDRDAVLLRFFEGQPFAEIGRRLRLSENAAQMRVERALEKLRVLLARRGVTSTTAALSAMLSDQPGSTAPPGIAATVTGVALSAAAGGSGLAFFHLMSSIKLQAGIGVIFLATGVTTAFLQRQSYGRLQRELASFSRQIGISGPEEGMRQILSQRAENQALAQSVTATLDLRAANASLADARRNVRALTVKAASFGGAANHVAGGAGPNIFDAAGLDLQPVPVSQPRPAYPASMVAAGSSGQVLVDFDVEADGTVGDVKTISTSDPAFAKAAVAAVQQWKFNPGQIAGQPVGTHLQVPMVFGISADSGGTVDGFYIATNSAPTSWF